jgi:4-hydroxybenzoyl-CoA reductase subunit beta
MGMKLPEFEYVEPKSIRKACQLLKEKGDKAQAIAGGTDLMMALKNRLKVPEMLVDLRGLLHLNRIHYSDEEGLKVGALVSLRRLSASPLVKEKYPILSRAALDVGTPQLQAMGTVGGNLCQDNLCLYYNRSPMLRQMLKPCHKLGGDVCHAVSRSKTCWATYAGDIAPVLLVSQAKIKIVDPKGEKIIPLNKLYSGDGKKPNVLKPGQILTEIQVPAPSPSYGEAYLKFRLRKAIDYPLLGVAVNLTMESTGQICKHAALALTAVERAPILIEEADELKGKKLTDAVIEKLAGAAYKHAHPLNNICELTPQYRKDLVKDYVKLAIQEAFQFAIKGEAI